MDKKIIRQLKETPFFEKATVLREFRHEADNSEFIRFIAISAQELNLNGFYQSPLGTIFHFKNNFPHNEDGPAVQHKHGKNEWWLDGVQMSEEAFRAWRLNQSLNINSDIKKKKLKV